MKKICLLNLGCKVNQYEIDALLNTLKSKYIVTEKLEYADMYIVNTCAVTLEAEKKSRQILSKILKLNNNAEIYIMGCASQNNPEQFLSKPQVKKVIGTFKKADILKETDCISNVFPMGNVYEDDFMSTNARTRGYIKIQDGCDNFCSYCLIPYVRGRSRSRDLNSIISEAKQLEKFCREIVITGINVSDYKINGKLALKEVLEALKDLLARIRFSSLEVNVITCELLEVLKNMKNFCPHFHLSLQSGSDKILKKMNRHYTTFEFLEKVNLIRSYFANASITTDVIVGFPLETEEDFENSLKFIERVKFSNIHYFAYSKRPGTVASRYKELNGIIIKDRENRLQILKEKLHKEYLKSQFNVIQNVLIEEEKDGMKRGFSEYYIKCYIEEDCKIGEIVSVRIEDFYLDGVKCKIIKTLDKKS